MSTSGAITVTGASDDIVTIKGAGVHEEIDCYDKAVTLAFSSGETYRAEYINPGVWDITLINGDTFDPEQPGPGPAVVSHAKATDPDGDWPAYTDQLVMERVRKVDVTVGTGEPRTIRFAG